MVDRLVLLSVRCVDLVVAEKRVHAERSCLIRNDGHHAIAELFITQQIAQEAGETHGGADGLFSRPRVELGEHIRTRQNEWASRAGDTTWQVAT